MLLRAIRMAVLRDLASRLYARILWACYRPRPGSSKEHGRMVLESICSLGIVERLVRSRRVDAFSERSAGILDPRSAPDQVKPP